MDNLSIFEWAKKGDVQELSILLLSKPDFNLEVRNDAGQTPLIVAVENNRSAFAHTLLNAGAKPNSKDTLGNTPLMIAAMKGRTYMCHLLVDNGARIDVENESYMTAYNWAEAFHRKRVIEYFRQISQTQFLSKKAVVNYKAVLKQFIFKLLENIKRLFSLIS